MPAFLISISLAKSSDELLFSTLSLFHSLSSDYWIMREAENGNIYALCKCLF